VQTLNVPAYKSLNVKALGLLPFEGGDSESPPLLGNCQYSAHKLQQNARINVDKRRFDVQSRQLGQSIGDLEFHK